MSRIRSRSPIRRDVRDDRRRNDRPSGRFNPNSDRMIYVTNLPYEMDWRELKDTIREQAGEVQFVEMLKNRDGKPKGAAIVELTSREAQQKCIDSLHQRSIGGRNVKCDEIRDPAAFFRRVREDTGVDLLGGRGGGGGDRRPRSRERRPSPGLPRSGETYGLSMNFLDSLGLKPPLVNRVFITNIPFTCSVGKLFDVFSLAGRITWFDLQLDKEGKSRGMCVVEYSHPIEAVQAISMLHNQRLLDRTITVKMDRFEKDPDRDRRGLPNGLRDIGMGLGANGAPLTDISSVIGQIQQQPAVNTYPANGFGGVGAGGGGSTIGLGPMVQQQAQPTQPTYPAFQNQPVQQLPPVVEQPHQAAVPSYGQMQPQPVRQASPPPANGSFYGQPPTYGQNQSPYVKQDPYIKQDFGSAPRGSYGAPPTGATPIRSASGTFAPGPLEPTTSRVILIKNLPEDYTWNVIAQRLRQFGDFESVDLVGSGVAKVRFLHVADAERARNTLHNTMVENNVISVEYII